MSTPRAQQPVETARKSHPEARARSNPGVEHLPMAARPALDRAHPLDLAGQQTPARVGERLGLVVVGFHGSKSSSRALQQAVGIARARGWDVEIVTAWPDADDVLIHAVPGRYIVARGHAVERQREALASLDPVAVASIATVLVNARPAGALLARCADADLLVVGAGRPERERDRRGVGTECVEAALCPVLVVPARPTEPGPTATPSRRERPQWHGRWGWRAGRTARG